MPYAKNRDIKIYYEVEGEGPPLVMLHGFSGNLGNMREAGYVDALKDDYLLVLMDLIGHGKSDKPHNPESYTLEEIGGDLTAVLDDLHISSANMMGYSGGGVHCLVLASQAKERVKSLILIS
jgi:pimeloyl-ACP methyl ester carboxylesterase